jgi:hypothetical protein
MTEKPLPGEGSYLDQPPRNLYEVCRHLGRPEGGKVCPACSIRGICEVETDPPA